MKSSKHEERMKSSYPRWYEESLIKRLEDKLSRATSIHKRQRYAKRIIAAKARLLAHVLTHS